MANKEQLEILTSGVEEWNKWRKEKRLIGDLDDARLRGADLRGANLVQTRFRFADLCGAVLSETDLRGAHFGNADLSGADLRGANLSSTRLSNAKLQGANLSYARLNLADLRSTDLRGVELYGASLQTTILNGANLSNAKVGRTDLSTRFYQVDGLDALVHNAPSSIGPEALEWAKGKLPGVFLKGIGFKDWEILSTRLHDPNLRADEVIDLTYKIADLRTKSPIQTNSIFFSYSSQDQAFVESIEKRFDDEGIRSWRDVHDLSGGPIEPQLDRAINLSGTVFLVLSKHSVNSVWVEWEVKRAQKRQKDRQAESGKRSDVLFPVALDDSWMTCHWPGWLKEQILEYKVVDCSDWKDEGFQEKYETKIRKPLGIYYRDEDKGE